MSRTTSDSAVSSAAVPTTVDAAVGPLTQKAVDDASDAVNKKYLADARNIVLGLANLLLTSKDPQDQAVVQLLASVNLGMRDVQLLVGLAAALMTAASERDSAEAAAREATSRLETARTNLHDATTSFSNLARGKLGPRSPALEKFGIKVIGGRKGMRRTSKKGAADKNDSGSTEKDSGAAPKA